MNKERPWWVHESASPVGGAVLIGLNTVLASFEDREKEDLPLGIRQQQAIQQADTDQLLILLQHHPQDWLYDGDDELGWLGHRPHLLFCGHVHRPNGLLSLPLDGQGHLTLVAGAGHADPSGPPEHAYSWGRLSGRAGLEYLPRLWIDHHKQFRADRNRFDSMDAKGVIRLAPERLPLRLRDWLRGHPVAPLPPPPDWQTDVALRGHIQAYLGNLRAACNRLPIKAIDPKVSFGGASFTLASLYCGLTAVPPPEPKSEQINEPESIPIEDRLSQPQYRFTLFGGDLGAGKTTILCHLAHQLAGSGTSSALPDALAGRIPVLVVLDAVLDTIAEAPDGNAELIWRVVEQAWQERAPGGPSAGSFDVVRRALKRDGLFLIDGLDELPENEAKPYRSRLLDALSTFAADLSEEDGLDRRSGSESTVAPETFDCFLSHNSADKPAVRALAQDLRARGISVWLDEERLRPGIPWQPLLEAGIRASRSVVVLVGRDGLGPWEAEETRAALSFAVRDGRSVIPVLLADAPAAPEIPMFLGERTWIDFRSGRDDGNASATDRLVWGITGSRPDEAGRSWASHGSGQNSLPRPEHGGQARILVTARPYSIAQQPPRFKRLNLRPMDPALIRQFISNWYRAAGAARSWDDHKIEARIRVLVEAIDERPFLQELAERPLLLTLIAGFADRAQIFPQNRAALLDSAVDLLLSRWHGNPDPSGQRREPELPPGCVNALRERAEQIRNGLEDLAYRLHEREQSSASGSSDTGLTRAEMIGWFGEWVPHGCHPLSLLKHLEQRSGILVSSPDGQGWTFLHRAIGEYLAACFIANGAKPDDLLRSRVDEAPAWWREVFLLTIGQKSQGGAGNALRFLIALLATADDDADTDWQITFFSALATRELGFDRTEEGRTLTKIVRERLARLVVEGRLEPKDRAEAGDLLGVFDGGDPRFGIGLDSSGLPDVDWIRLDGGVIEVGDDPEGRRDQVPPFCIARYPTTVAQFEAFIAAGGYGQQQHWTESGWRWITNAEREEPAGWAAQRSYPNRPAVGITWYEAMAFCRWLSTTLTQGKRFIGLPKEEQWEYAARGRDRRTFPWGDADWNPQLANCGTSGLGHPSTVGMYPLGQSPEGVHDLAGNTREWTRSLYEDAAVTPRTERDDPGSFGARSVRGGSWSTGTKDLAAAKRDLREPASDDPDLGFRLVMQE